MSINNRITQGVSLFRPANNQFLEIGCKGTIIHRNKPLENDIVKETHEMIRQICEKGEMSIEVDKGYQAVGILYKGKYVVTAAAHDGYGEANMAALRNTLLLIFLVSILLMVVVGYILATLTIRPIERTLTSQKMFASNVSHELRTPLAAIMGELVLHNATIDVQTKEGHGTKFIISFTNNN